MNYKIFYLLLIMIFLTGCVSKKDYISLYNKHEKLISQKEKLTTKNKELTTKNKELKNSLSDKKKNIEELRDTNLQLKANLSRLERKYKSLKTSYEQATRTADYYYKSGIDLLNNENYKKALNKFETVIEKYPTNDLAKSAKSKIDDIKNISNNNYNTLMQEIKELQLKKKVDFIKDKKESIFLTQSDSIKLNKQYEKILAQYETEKYISKENDKMQSCYFYETKRNTDQEVGSDTDLRFELYIVKQYSGRKYFRIRTRYSSSDWMFYEEVTIRGSNGVQFTIETEYPEKETNSSSYGVREWSDNKLNNSLNWKIFKISKAEEVHVRYDGKYRHDIALNKEQMKAFKEIVAKYKKL